MKETGVISTGERLKKASSPPIFNLFPGEEQEVQLTQGSCYFRETSFPLDYRHGSNILEEARDCTENSLELLLREPPTKVYPWEGVFLDLETTGLSGGSGTWAFMIGAGWVEDDQLKVRQYFLRRPGEERAMLCHFVQKFKDFDTLITFNGKAFDLPLLHNRQVMTGMTPLWKPANHVDLLHCARRIWKGIFASCSLTALEENLIKFYREGDIPGEEIPEVYFQYLRRGETSRIKRVFEHNRWDIITMVALVGVLGKLEQGDFWENASLEEVYALGNLLWKRGRISEAIEYFHRVKDEGSTALEKKALYALGYIHKQRREWESSVYFWENLLEKDSHSLDPCLELAKIYEHQTGEWQRAWSMTNEALNRAYRRYQMGGDEEEIVPLRHRLLRLEKKLSSPDAGSYSEKNW